MVVEYAAGDRPVARKTLLRRLWHLRRCTLAWRPLLIEHAPPWSRRIFGRVASHLDMLLVDHGIFRLLYLNKFRLGNRAWRSAQPAPHHIRALARRGLRTIINLRGERQCGSYWLERAACERHGIALVDFRLRSRTPPTREELRAVRDLFEHIEYPVLLHCKSGADRAGVMSVLYLFLVEGVPMVQAKHELSLRFGHIRHSDTGVLDYFFERFIDDTRQRPMPFFEWVDTVYDGEELKRSFRAEGWARRLTDNILRRE
ncbi:MAG: dual specificity protein phosphatase family protein [Hyphomicrobiaceae bacterium]|nr:MAG: dual specificity protein phosphatase family protein [Hyphomicrobiaceae bacterium]